MEFIDIHCHVLPGVDDGAKNIETTREMFRIASENSTSIMIATPHYKRGRFTCEESEIDTIFNECAKISTEYGIRLLRGREIFLDSRAIEEYAAGSLCSMNGTDCVLVEFDPSSDWRYIRSQCTTLLAMNVVPVLAHCERYTYLRNSPERYDELHSAGVLLQVNAETITTFMADGKKEIFDLIYKDKVSFIASDAHGAQYRRPTLKKAYQKIKRKFDVQTADRLFYENAAKFFQTEDKGKGLPDTNNT